MAMSRARVVKRFTAVAETIHGIPLTCTTGIEGHAFADRFVRP